MLINRPMQNDSFSRTNGEFPMASLKSRIEHAITPAALRSYLAEFISTFIFVFAAVGASISAKLSPEANGSNVTAIAMASGFALSAAVFISGNISGGHVNPAVTFGVAIQGHISIATAIFYWVSQILASIFSCLLVQTLIVEQKISIQEIPSEMTGFGASIIEGLMTFGLVYTFYGSLDPRKGPAGAVGPLFIGLILGANILASGSITGGSMNPALSFGKAIVSGNFRNQAVYWIGPLIGGGLAGVMYDNVMFPTDPIVQT